MTENSTATSAPGASLLPDGTATLTTIHFALIAILAVLVIAGILWGIRQKRTRVQAKRDVVTNAEEAGVAPVETVVEERVAAAPLPVSPAPAAPISVAPAPPPITPPPIADAPVADTPAAPDMLADEPIPAVAAFEASPASEAVAPAPVPTATSYADGPVTQLKGLGPKVAARLGELGVTTVGQIASLTEDQAQALDVQLGAFSGRMGRDRWIEQARFLAAGDKAGFEAVFGKL